ncbi:hypothetical protein C8Q74DRAFT_20295 [Fomes fomentarius]|nr:hypothetical protein C8Q74DRAFT_20295 [Fomes fomentarius]
MKLRPRAARYICQLSFHPLFFLFLGVQGFETCARRPDHHHASLDHYHVQHGRRRVRLHRHPSDVLQQGMAAWPLHKQMCRLRPQALNELGYATPLALRQTLNEWVETHYWSLTTVVNAAVYRAGGWEFVLKNSRACVLQLQPEKHTDSGNPASAFRLMQTRITHKDSHDCLH